MERIRPLHERVVVRPLEELSRTAGGIVIPDTAAQKPVRGEVVAAGTGKRSRTAHVSTHPEGGR